jgi:pimeloyl-ACP methyl ester carboxylesterase
MAVTLIYGSADIMKPADGHAIAAALRREPAAVEADLHVIRGAGHHPYASHAEQFHRALFHAMDAAHSHGKDKDKRH